LQKQGENNEREKIGENMTEIKIELPSKRNREESLRRFAKQLGGRYSSNMKDTNMCSKKLKRGKKVDVYGFQMTVMDVVEDGVYVSRGSFIHKFACDELNPVNKHTIKKGIQF